MTSEKFSLKWNDFQPNISNVFSNLREDTNFSDVTLVSEDGQPVEAHKIILTASSPFFMNMLKITKHPQPIIYLKGFKARYLKSVLDFMYHGVADIYQDDLEQFLSLAEELQLKGLTGGEEDKEDEEENYKQNSDKYSPNILKTIDKTIKPNLEAEPLDDEQHFQNQTTTVMTTENLQTKVLYTGGNSEDLKSTICSLIFKNGTIITCTVCGKTKDETVDKNAKYHMESHVESLHVDGVTYNCTKCDKTFRSKNALHKHTFRYHKQ